MLEIWGLTATSDRRRPELDQRLLEERQGGGRNYNPVVIGIPLNAVYSDRRKVEGYR
jgi:hypothetical protein